MNRLIVRTATLPGGRAGPVYVGARASLLGAAFGAVGLDLGDAAGVVRQHCPTCGGTDHGRPHVPAALAAGWHVSVAHTATRLAVAVSDTPCGVDLEDVDAVGRAPVAAVLLAPDEPEDRLARTWVRKEAILKAAGHGLAVDPALLVLGPAQDEPRLLRWDGPGPPPAPVAWYEDDLAGGDAPRALLSAVALRVP